MICAQHCASSKRSILQAVNKPGPSDSSERGAQGASSAITGIAATLSLPIRRRAEVSGKAAGQAAV